MGNDWRDRNGRSGLDFVANGHREETERKKEVMISGHAPTHNEYGALSAFPLILVGASAWWAEKKTDIMVPILITAGVGIGLMLILWLLLGRKKRKKS